MSTLPNRVSGCARTLALAGLTALVLLSGCKVSTQLGEPCFLVRKARAGDPDPNARFVRVTYGEIPTGTDALSFGAAECDDLTCVLDADSPRRAPNAEAQGYCTEACVRGQSACEVTDDGVRSDNPDLAARMTCRSLILDEQTLAALRQEQPELYRQSFGDNAASSFCAGALREADEGS